MLNSTHNVYISSIVCHATRATTKRTIGTKCDLHKIIIFYVVVALFCFCFLLLHDCRIYDATWAGV